MGIIKGSEYRGVSDERGINEYNIIVDMQDAVIAACMSF